MKRYTARLCPGDDWASIGQARSIIEQAHRRDVYGSRYSLGAVAQADDNVVLVKIRSVEKRVSVAERFRRLETELGAEVEHVGWGWLITGSKTRSAGLVQTADADPYASVSPQVDDVKEYSERTQLWPDGQWAVATGATCNCVGVPPYFLSDSLSATRRGSPQGG